MILKKAMGAKMKKFTLYALLLMVFLLSFGWAVGSFAHWFYYNMMIVFSKLTFAIMFGSLALVVLALLIAVVYKRSGSDQ